MSYQILRLPAVISITGLARSTIYAKIAEGQFPKPVNLSARSVGWLETDINNWLSERIKESRRCRVARLKLPPSPATPLEGAPEWHAVTQEQVDNIESQSFIWPVIGRWRVSRLVFTTKRQTTIALSGSELSADGYDVFFSS